MGFRGKQIATLTLVAGVVALATSLVNAASLARLSVSETSSRLELLASTFYHQVSRIIREHPGDDLKAVLAADPSLRNFADAIVGYSPTTLYVTITDPHGFAILHSDPSRAGFEHRRRRTPDRSRARAPPANRVGNTVLHVGAAAAWTGWALQPSPRSTDDLKGECRPSG